MEEKIRQWDGLPLDEFTEEIKKVISETPNCFEDELLSLALEYFSQGTGIEYNFMLYAMAEEELRRAAKNGLINAGLADLLEECVMAERRFYEMLYKPESFEPEAIKWLPGECQYNDILFRFICDGKKNPRMIIDAAKMRPDMAQVFKCWMGA